jgi:hypothetical protein
LTYALQFATVAALMALVEVGKRRAMRSALWASAIMACGSFVTVSYVGDRSLIVAAILGAFVGTYFVVRRESAA